MDTTERLVPTPIHRITTSQPGAPRRQRALAACPRRGCAVDVAACASCPHARGFLGGASGDDGPRQVLCSVERASAPDATGTVGDVMRRDVACVDPDMDLDDVVLLFIERAIGGLPVVDAHERPLGMISKTDLVDAFRRQHRAPSMLDAMLDSFDAEVAGAPAPLVARDLMTRDVWTLRERDPVARAAELFAATGVHRAPVVDVDGKVVGVITAFDIVRAIAGDRAAEDGRRTA